MVTEATAQALNMMATGHMRVAGLRPNPAIDDKMAEVNQQTVQRGPVIDIQKVYDDFSSGTTPFEFYEHQMQPPWITSVWAYENRHGNPIVMVAVTEDREEVGSKWRKGHDEYHEWMEWQSQADTHEIDWDRVRWKWLILFWSASRSEIHGPLFLVKIAVYDDGVPADIHWNCMYPETHPLGNPDIFQTELAMLCKAVDIANCRNVQTVLAQPSGDRATRRRVQRALGDVRMSTLSITPQGKSYRGAGAGEQGVPLHSVRGHVAHYGACCSWHEPKGLLFGKLTARVWVPEHARGDENLGENKHTYEVTT